MQKLKGFSVLEHFPSYIENVAADNPYPLLDEIKNRRHYKARGRRPYSSAMIRYAWILPLPSVSQLNKLQTGGVDAIKAVNVLCKKEEFQVALF